MPLKLTTNVQVVPNVLPHKGKNPSKPTSITVKFKAPSEEVTDALLAQTNALFKAKLAVNDLMTKHNGATCYINWQPKDFETEVGGVMQWLDSQKCEDVQIQLESGRGITE